VCAGTQVLHDRLRGLGESCLAGAFYQESLEWAESLADVEALPERTRNMLAQAFRESLVTPYGMVDDYASLLMPWGFDLGAVVCPTKVIAREDTSVPPAHRHWLVEHVPNAVAVVVDGGHMGPRDEPEEELLGWVGDADADIAKGF
jgi:pimeloyl-ACP methyl ester carboxylesterase